MSSLIQWRGEMDSLRSEMERLYDRLFDLRPFRRFTDEGEWMPSVDFLRRQKRSS